MKFSDYNSSQIVPQMTLLEKFNSLIKWLKDNADSFKIAGLYRHNVAYKIGAVPGFLHILSFNSTAYTSAKDIINDNLKFTSGIVYSELNGNSFYQFILNSEVGSESCVRLTTNLSNGNMLKEVLTLQGDLVEEVIL